MYGRRRAQRSSAHYKLETHHIEVVIIAALVVWPEESRYLWNTQLPSRKLWPETARRIGIEWLPTIYYAQVACFKPFRA